ncbi:unannotated protein [freshwater metagenome]|uniref:Unannotated protein n=1 Tax=freshwater metagenome TaxID=449393 RepID=A0A6J7XRF6_9ZZZZ|nr:hypothetical protein [Actinomycetota bacterium]
MSQARPLRLRREVIPVPAGPVASHNHIARVWVDSGVAHLDGYFDYEIPQALSEQVRAGVRVGVSFAGREVEALVLARLNSSDSGAHLKSITRVLSPIPLASPATLSLIENIAREWACHPFELIRSAIPPRVVLSEKAITAHAQSWWELRNSKIDFAHKPSKTYFSHSPSVLALDEVLSLALDNIARGKVLILVPDENNLDVLQNILRESTNTVEVLRLDSTLARSTRYSHFLRICLGSPDIVIGTRSAVFAPIQDLATIIIVHESSEQFYEPRSPGWNVRAVADERSKSEGINIIYTGYSPSIEVGMQIEAKEIKYLSASTRVPVNAFAQTSGELLPDRIFSPIRSALRDGTVLFLVPRKGYGNALLCAKCRNIAYCSCGGRLAVAGSGMDPQCVVCLRFNGDWKCSWCQSTERYYAARGIDRAVEEIGRAFPNNAIVSSSGDHILRGVGHETKIVVSTPGSIPHIQGGYSAVVILEGLRFLAGTDFKSTQRATEFFFDAASHKSIHGAVLIVLDNAHPVVAALARWNPTIVVKNELRDRKELSLPPYVTTTSFEIDASEAARFASGLRESVTSHRLPPLTKIYGPTPIGSSRSRIHMTTPLDGRLEVAQFLRELNRRRAIAKKIALVIRIDPYSLI